MQRSVRPGHIGRGQGLFVLTYYVAAAFSGLLFAGLASAFGWSAAGFRQLLVLPLVSARVLLLVDSSRMVSPPRPTGTPGTARS